MILHRHPSASRSDRRRWSCFHSSWVRVFFYFIFFILHFSKTVLRYLDVGFVFLRLFNWTVQPGPDNKAAKQDGRLRCFIFSFMAWMIIQPALRWIYCFLPMCSYSLHSNKNNFVGWDATPARQQPLKTPFLFPGKSSYEIFWRIFPFPAQNYRILQMWKRSFTL